MTLFKGVKVNDGDKVRIVLEAEIRRAEDFEVKTLYNNFSIYHPDVVSVEVLESASLKAKRPWWWPPRPGDVIAYYGDEASLCPSSTAVVTEEGRVVGRYATYDSIEDFAAEGDRRQWKNIVLYARCAE